MNGMKIVPITLKEANGFVASYHRHHRPTVGCKFAIGLQNNGDLVGVAICGRPVSRYLDDGLTLEVNRLCTDGTKNACSMLYGAACRIAKEMGYRKVITYTLESETEQVCERVIFGLMVLEAAKYGQGIAVEITVFHAKRRNDGYMR